MTASEPDPKSLPWEDRLRLLPELLGIEAQLVLNSMGEVGPVKYHLADLMRPIGTQRKVNLALATSAELVEELHSRITAYPPTEGTING
jgi:hypothetical protein